MKDKVSVIIPLYNHEKYIKDAILSVLNQTHQVYEILIIDDGSTDNSARIVKDNFGSNPLIKYFYQENQGAHHAINRGIEESSGDFVSILNSDDIFKNDKIERCLDIFSKNKKVEIVFGGVDFIDDQGKPLKNTQLIDWQNRGLFFLKNSNLFTLAMLNENIITTTSNMFFCKSLCNNKIRFYKLRYCHDLDFIVSSIKEENYFFDKNNIHIEYRCHDSNTIKENISNIKIEIAAVVCVALVEQGMSILNNKNENLKYFFEFLKNKNFSNLILFLMIKYLKNKNKDLFYEDINKEGNRDMFKTLLN